MVNGNEQNQDANYPAVSGKSQRHRLPTMATVTFSAYNYVWYEGEPDSFLPKGEQSFLGIISWTPTPPSKSFDFFFIYEYDTLNFKNLFIEDKIDDIPIPFRDLICSYSKPGRWIYIYDPPRDDYFEINYRGPKDWDATCYIIAANGDDLQIDARKSSRGELFTLKKQGLNDMCAIALPYQISSKAFFEMGVEMASNPIWQKHTKIIKVNGAAPLSGPEYCVRVFDPALIVENLSNAIRFYSRLVNVIDPRQKVWGMNSWEKNARKKGILACLCNQLADKDSDVKDAVMGSKLDDAFNRFANYGFRKARLCDNVYNFLRHPIMERLEKLLMCYSINEGMRPDGKVWLKIVGSLADLAGEHTLLTDYFVKSAEKKPTESAWSSYFQKSLGKGTKSESASVFLWLGFLQGQDIAKLLGGIAEARAYQLISEYTSVRSRMTWRNFNKILMEERKSLIKEHGAVPQTGAFSNGIEHVNTIYKWIGRLGSLKGVFDGNITATDFSNGLETLSELAEKRGAVVLATKLVAVKNILDLCQNTKDFAKRIQIDDYDAALGTGVLIGAGLAELGYLIATGTILGGPVGTAVAIVAAIGGIILMFAIDSDVETFMKHCLWGKYFRKSKDQPEWAYDKFSWWDDTDFGIDGQLSSLLNILHKYSVSHAFDKDHRQLEIQISTTSFPDSAKFVFKGKFYDRDGNIEKVKFEFQFPSRKRNTYRWFYDQIKGTKITDSESGAHYRYPSRAWLVETSATARVFSKSGKHILLIHLEISKRTTSGEGWICCYPFGTDEFLVPQVYEKDAFHLRNFIKDDEEYEFERKEFGKMPSW